MTILSQKRESVFTKGEVTHLKGTLKVFAICMGWTCRLFDMHVIQF